MRIYTNSLETCDFSFKTSDLVFLNKKSIFFIAQNLMTLMGRVLVENIILLAVFLLIKISS